jgi:Tfp pilus assembly protein PilX
VSMLKLRPANAPSGDGGSSIILTMIVLAVLSGLGMTVFALSTDNLGNARRDRQASSALANSEAGVAQAIAYLKNRGTGQLVCAPDCGATNPWGEEPAHVDGDADPSMQVTLSSQEVYSVWIETVQAMTPTTAGLYRVHSVGNSGTGPGARTVEVDVQLAPFEFPLAVFADSIQAGGTGAITTESLFSTGCIFKRSKINFQGIDPVYGIPAAAHSSQYITDSQATGSSCTATDVKNIHKPTGTTPKPCNTSYPYDQDRQGGDLSGTACQGVGGAYPQTSLISDNADMESKYGFNLDGLTPGQIQQLRTAAQEQGFYFTNTAAIPAALQSDVTSLQYPNPVLFYEFASSVPPNSRLVDLNDLSDVTYGRATPLAAGDPGCHSRNVIVVVLNGDVRLNSNQTLVASIFALGPAPYGEVKKANGTSQLIGTLYARSIDLTGTANIDLDGCFLANLPGQLLNVTATSFREVDR